MKTIFAIFLLGIGTASAETSKLPPLNQYVLWAVNQMPKGGGYLASKKAIVNLQNGVALSDQGISTKPKVASPSFCSGATYCVFLKVIDKLIENGSLKMTGKQRWEFLKIDEVPDGHGIWGRWNANGPGTAKLFAELKCGKNFTSYDHALPGDFMKIWWTEEIGGKERGHLVVYLGAMMKNGKKHIRFWSSNIPGGYGEKVVPRTNIKHVLFSRFENHRQLAKAGSLPEKNRFLEDMLRKSFTWKQVARECGVHATPGG